MNENNISEIVFLYWNGRRCHAKVVESLSGNERYIGRYDDFEVYQIRTVLFNQFGFVARYHPECKIIKGEFVTGSTVEVVINGTEIKRKVRYSKSEGNAYIAFNGKKYFLSDFKQ